MIANTIIYLISYLFNMVSNTIVAPRFTPGEIEVMNRLISRGYAKSRADLVRYATKQYCDQLIEDLDSSESHIM